MEEPEGDSRESSIRQHLKQNMAKYELTKTIEAVKLNQRTMRPLGPQKFTIPYGALLENLSLDRDVQQFFYLGEPYECPQSEIQSALKEL